MAEAQPGAPDALRLSDARLWRPPLLLLGVAALCWAVYQRAPRAIAEPAIVPYAAILVLGPSLVYPWLRRRGAAPSRAALACGLVPAAWLAKELYRVSGVFSAAEALYYATNPLALGLFTAGALQMAVWELCLERARAGRWRPRSGAGLVVAAVLLLAGGFALAAGDSGGRDFFYAWIDVYRALFPGA
jgi:hypothetical protein